MSGDPVQVGVVGLGYWGPNLARNFDRVPGSSLRWICDASETSRARWAPQFPDARATAELDDLLTDPDLDAATLAVSTAERAVAEATEMVREAAQSVARAQQTLASLTERMTDLDGRVAAHPDAATVTAKATGKVYKFKPLGDVRPVVDAGGLFNYARQSGMIAAK